MAREKLRLFPYDHSLIFSDASSGPVFFCGKRLSIANLIFSLVVNALAERDNA